jgi:hypothetical protein
MRSLFILLLALGVGQAFADNCTDLAKRFASDQNSLKVGELDDLKSCISDLEQAKAQAPDPVSTTSSAASVQTVTQVDPVSLPISQ